jgi:hypothetical protein
MIYNNNYYYSQHLQFVVSPSIPPTLEDKLKDYHSKCCDSNIVSQEKMVDFIQMGKFLVQQIQTNVKQEPFTKEEICAFLWYLMSIAISDNKGFYDGMFVLTDPDSKIFNLLKASPGVYVRVSTHFTESSNRWRHYGIDLRNMGLPAKKHTLVFAQRANGTLFLKMEEHGCPPFLFFAIKFFSIRNFLEFTGHAIDYVCTRKVLRTLTRPIKILFIRKSSINNPYPPRTEEEIDIKIATTFLKALKQLKETKDLHRSIIHRHWSDAKKYGISKMHEILSKIEDNLPSIQDAKNLIQSMINEDPPNSDRKGSEVIIDLEKLINN